MLEESVNSTVILNMLSRDLNIPISTDKPKNGFYTWSYCNHMFTYQKLLEEIQELAIIEDLISVEIKITVNEKDDMSNDCMSFSGHFPTFHGRVIVKTSKDIRWKHAPEITAARYFEIAENWELENHFRNYEEK